MESQEVLTSCLLQMPLLNEILQTDRNLRVAAVPMPHFPMPAFHMGTFIQSRLKISQQPWEVGIVLSKNLADGKELG